MKPKKLLQIISILFLSILLINCKKTTESESNWGDADFTTFVAIGNSLTAGVADGALYEDSQKNSFPNLIAKMSEVDNDFEQPIMGGNGFSFNEAEGRLTLNIFTDPPSIDFLPAGTENNSNLNRAYNNLGIPLIRAEQLYTATTSVEADSNHFVDKIIRGSGRTAIEEALSLNPTLITLWIGSNDVLESATLGLADNNSPYTPSNEFATHLTNIINQLTIDTDAPIFIANIVDITDLPYFTSLPSSVIVGGNQTYLFGECENNVIRQLTDDDIVLFWALPDYLSLKTSGDISVATALNDTLILDRQEKTEITTIIDEYNVIIQNIANSNNQLYLVDMYSRFKNIAGNGYTVGGINYTAELIYFDSSGNLNLNLTSTLFSYDALHPNKFGYASFANSFIEVINASLNANIPPISELSDLN
ncbi:SGNH/GDSL hydrolase family protein [Candidatus Neomarinimicrobiota bacterium]